MAPGLELIGFAGLSVPVGGVALLDGALTATPVAAYSTRKLRTAYSGPCMKVRRSSDNTTQDIGFAGSDLDTASMLTFCGAGNGFIDTWYDQQGSNNLVQATTAYQPKIVSSGATVTKNTKPCAIFDVLLSSVALSGVTGLNSVSQFTGSAVASSINSGGDRIFWLQGSGIADEYSSDAGALMLYRNSATTIQSYRTIAQASATIVSDQLFTALSLWDATNNTIYVDGAAGTPVAKNASLSATSVTIGLGTSTSGNFLNGYIGEAIIWASALDGTDRSTLQTDQKAYWGTP